MASVPDDLRLCGVIPGDFVPGAGGPACASEDEARSLAVAGVEGLLGTRDTDEPWGVGGRESLEKREADEALRRKGGGGTKEEWANGAAPSAAAGVVGNGGSGDSSGWSSSEGASSGGVGGDPCISPTSSSSSLYELIGIGGGGGDWSAAA